MNLQRISLAISAAALVLLVLHVLFPNLGIDATATGLLILAALPWLLPFVKTFELPGGTKIEVREVKAATNKITVYGVQIESAPSQAPALPPPPDDPISVLKEVARSDANLVLVGFRIEIERRLRRLAAQLGIDVEGRSALAIMRELRRAGLLPPNVAGGLEELIACNRSTADFLLSSPLMQKTYERRLTGPQFSSRRQPDAQPV